MVMVVDIPIGTNESVLERAIEVAKDGGADRVALCHVIMSNKQAPALITIESLGKRIDHHEKALYTGPCLEACKQEDNGAQ